MCDVIPMMNENYKFKYNASEELKLDSAIKYNLNANLNVFVSYAASLRPFSTTPFTFSASSPLPPQKKKIKQS